MYTWSSSQSRSLTTYKIQNTKIEPKSPSCTMSMQPIFYLFLFVYVISSNSQSHETWECGQMLSYKHKTHTNDIQRLSTEPWTRYYVLLYMEYCIFYRFNIWIDHKLHHESWIIDVRYMHTKKKKIHSSRIPFPYWWWICDVCNNLTESDQLLKFHLFIYKCMNDSLHLHSVHIENSEFDTSTFFAIRQRRMKSDVKNVLYRIGAHIT